MTTKRKGLEITETINEIKVTNESLNQVPRIRFLYNAKHREKLMQALRGDLHVFMWTIAKMSINVTCHGLHVRKDVRPKMRKMIAPFAKSIKGKYISF